MYRQKVSVILLLVKKNVPFRYPERSRRLRVVEGVINETRGKRFVLATLEQGSLRSYEEIYGHQEPATAIILGHKIAGYRTTELISCVQKHRVVCKEIY